MTRRARPGPEGPDLFDMLEEAKLERPAPCLYRTGTAAGLIGRLAEFDAWAGEHGRFGCVPRSHGWHGHDIPPAVNLNRAYTDMLLDRCQPAILTADLRRWPRTAPVPPCGCDGPLLYRAACRGRGCSWESPEHDRENPAAEDGMGPRLARLARAAGHPGPAALPERRRQGTARGRVARQGEPRLSARVDRGGRPDPHAPREVRHPPRTRLDSVRRL